VPRIIIALGRRYVQYINTSYRRTGTLWDSRYKSSLIQAETYYLTCQRYIELNPLRAGLVDGPAHYRRTGYRHNALGQPNAPPHAARGLSGLGSKRQGKTHGLP
jgi:putative transposase